MPEVMEYGSAEEVLEVYEETAQADPSSEIEYIESRNTVGSLSSSVKGKASPLESKAATESINLLFPSPGSPCNSVTLPKGIYGYHSHFTLYC